MSIPHKPELEKKLTVGNQVIVYHAHFDDVSMTQWPYLLDENYLKQYGLIQRTVQGRGDTHFFTWNQHHWVLRHYYRGGLVGKFNKDLYINKPLNQTRAYREWAMLIYIQSLNLPSAKPVAIRLVKGGLFHYADILTEAIQNVFSLNEYLTQSALSANLWQAMGRTIKQFHQYGIYHDDLNAHNILLNVENERVYLIDFDKGDVRDTKNVKWMQGNLDRLKRSLKKEQSKHSQYQFDESNWSELMKGYESV